MQGLLMFYSLLSSLNNVDSTIYRALFAFFTALVLGLACGGKLINFLKHHQGKGQPIREDGPKSHLETKKGTPTMGGLLIVGTTLLSSLLWCNLHSLFVWSSLGIFIFYATIGFIDDYIKVTKHSSNAITGKTRLLLEFTAALIVVLLLSLNTAENGRFVLTVPYFKHLTFDLFWFYVPFAMVVIVGTSNSVNLSDGLDGLAGGLCVIAFFAFLIIALVCGTPLAHNFYIMPISGAGETAVIAAAVIGGCISFLWFNAPPAKIFMGDTGSLALGGLLGTIAVITKHEIILAIVGGIFVMEALSDIIQVFWYKRTKRRVFLMAPIHHHFEQLGWKETTVVLRFWIVGFILAVLGLASLRLIGA